MFKQEERKKWVSLLNAIHKIEVRGASVIVMAQVIAFIENEISDIDKLNNEENKENKGG